MRTHFIQRGILISSIPSHLLFEDIFIKPLAVSDQGKHLKELQGAGAGFVYFFPDHVGTYPRITKG